MPKHFHVARQGKKNVAHFEFRGVSFAKESAVHRRRPTRLIYLAIGVLFTICICANDSRGQVIEGDLAARLISRLTTTVAEDDSNSAFVPPPRESVRPLNAAAKAIQQKKYGVAAGLLGEFLTGELPQDYLLQVGEAEAVSLRNAARELLAAIPPDELSDYRLKFSTIAEQELAKGVEAGDRKLLTGVSSRYFFTEAGMQATMLLGYMQLEQGELVAAAAAFQRIVNYPSARERFDPEASVLLATSLLLMGNEPAAKKVLAELVERNNAAPRRAPLKFLDTDIDLPRKSDVALEWLFDLIGRSPLKVNSLIKDWRMVNGNPQRNAASLAGLPLFVPNWSVSIHPDEESDAEVPARLARKISAGEVVIPALKPLAIDNMIIMRNSAQMIGVDFQSGKRIWVYPPENPIADVKKTMPKDIQHETASRAATTGAENRILTDSIYGEASSDGKCVFVIPRTAASDYTPLQIDARASIADPANQGDTNVLNAIRLDRQGALKWQIGGTNGHDEPKLANANFLGAPLPVDGVLYAICRQKEVILLTAIDSESGKLIWSQQLAISPMEDEDEEILPAALIGSLSPSFSNGILVCPTGQGTLVGVSADDRSLLWGYNFHQAGLEIDPFAPGLANEIPVYGIQSSSIRDAWLENRIVIEQGLVACTPRFERQLVVLDLLNGRPIRSAVNVEPTAKSHGALFLGCLNAGKALVVAIDHCRQIDLYSGREIWRTELKSFGSPSGTGFFANESYYLPTTSAEVIEISLNNGKITRSNVAPQVLGNLIAYQGSILSHGLDRLISIAQDEPAEQLLGRLPKEVIATWNMELVRAQLLVQKGDIRGAIEAAEAAWRLNPNEVAKKFLATFYTQQMHVDPEFVSPLMKQLVEQDPVLKVQLRLAAMEQMDERRVASEILEILHAVPADELARVVEISGQLGTNNNRKGASSIRIDRWLGARLAKSIQGGRANDLVEKILDDLEQSGVANSTRRQFYSGVGFGNLNSKRLLAAATLLEPSHSHVTEEILRIVAGRSGDSHAETAALIFLDKLVAQNRLAEARAFCESSVGSISGPQLQAKVAEVRSRQDPANEQHPAVYGRSALCRRLNGGEWDDEYREEIVGDSILVNNFNLDSTSPTEPTFRVFRDDRIVAFDKFGAAIAVFEKTDSAPGTPSDAQQKRNRRHLEVGGNREEIDEVEQWNASRTANCFSRGNRRLLQTAGGLWVFQVDSKNLAKSICLWNRTNIDLGKLNRGSLPGSLGENGSTILGSAFLATLTDHDEVVYCDAGLIRCVDGQDGSLIWEASRVQPASHLLIRGRVVIAYDSQEGVIRKYSLGDGHLLSTTAYPKNLEFATATQNLVIGVQRDQGQVTIVGFDPFVDNVVWTLPLKAKSKAQLFGLNRLALVEPRGDLEFVDLNTGKATASMSIPYEYMTTTNVWGLDVHQVGDRLIVSVVTKATEDSIDFNRNATWLRWNHVTSTEELSTGYLFCVDSRTGESKWGSPLRFEGLQWLYPEGSQVPLLVGMRRFDLNSYERDIERMEHQFYFVDLVSGEEVARFAHSPLQFPSLSLRAFPAEKNVWVQLGSACLEVAFQSEAPPRPRSQLTLRRALPVPSEWLTVKTEPVTVPVSRAKIIERLKKAQEDLETNRQELQKKLGGKNEK